MPYAINSTCTKCGACLSECPTDSIYEGKAQFYIDADTCADHAACLNVCPVNAIFALTDGKTAADEALEDEEE